MVTFNLLYVFICMAEDIVLQLMPVVITDAILK